MLSSSLVLVVLVAGSGALAVAVLVWALLRGWLEADAIQRQQIAILEDEDLRAERPWETAAQRADRVARHGPPLAASWRDGGGGA